MAVAAQVRNGVADVDLTHVQGDGLEFTLTRDDATSWPQALELFLSPTADRGNAGAAIAVPKASEVATVTLTDAQLAGQNFWWLRDPDAGRIVIAGDVHHTLSGHAGLGAGLATDLTVEFASTNVSVTMLGGAGGGPDATGATDGYVWTADGADGADWEAVPAGGGTEFADDVFRIQDDGDATKQVAFQASGITTGTTRTVTVPDNDVDLGGVTLGFDLYITATDTSNFTGTVWPAISGAIADGATLLVKFDDGTAKSWDVVPTSTLANETVVTTLANYESHRLVSAAASLTNTSALTFMVYTTDGINFTLEPNGNVVGPTPGSATDSGVVLFDGTTGSLLKDGGVLGTAAFDATGDFATAAQGTLADSATQPGDLGTAAAEDVGYFATAAQGTDARTPTSHATSHEDGGADELALDASQTTTGVFNIARLATGTPDGTKFVRDDGTLQTPAGGGGGAVQTRPLETNLLGLPGHVRFATADSYSLTVSRVSWVPFLVDAAITVTDVYAYCRSASASSNTRFAIAPDDPAAVPKPSGTLVWQSAEFDTSTTGSKTTTGLSLSLAAGIYLVGFQSSGTPQFSSQLSSSPGMAGMFPGIDSSAYGMIYTNNTYGAFPDPFTTAVGGRSNVTTAPVVMKWTVD